MAVNAPSSSPSVEDMDTYRKDLSDRAPDHVEEADGLTWTEEEEKALVRRVDLFLLPTIWLMYLLSYMDRTKYVHSWCSQTSLLLTALASEMPRLPAWRMTSS